MVGPPGRGCVLQWVRAAPQGTHRAPALSTFSRFLLSHLYEQIMLQFLTLFKMFKFFLNLKFYVIHLGSSHGHHMGAGDAQPLWVLSTVVGQEEKFRRGGNSQHQRKLTAVKAEQHNLS